MGVNVGVGVDVGSGVEVCVGVEVGISVDVGSGELAGISAGERVAVATLEGVGVYVEVGVAAAALWTLMAAGVARIFASVAACAFGVGGMLALAVLPAIVSVGISAGERVAATPSG